MTRDVLVRQLYKMSGRDQCNVAHAVFAAACTSTRRLRARCNPRDGDTFLEDPKGHDFSSLAEARMEAIMSARELMSSRVAAGKNPNHSKFEITDETGKAVLVVFFDEAIDRS